MLCACAVAVFLGWALLLGWRPGLVVASHDALAGSVVQAQHVLAVGGAWTDALFRLDVQGGAAMHPVTGTPAPQAWAARAGLSPTAALNGTVFFLQACFAFLGARLAVDLAATWTNDGARASPLARAALVSALAFAPLLAWKVPAGHQTMLEGTFPLLVAAASIVAARRGTATLTLVAVSAAALATSFSTSAAQPLLYAAVFGAPLLVAAAWPPARTRAFATSWTLAVLVVLGSLAWAAPKLVPMVAYATGPDAARTLGDADTLYSFVVGAARDWVAGVPWAVELLPSGRPLHLRHETNYPLGPPLLLLALAPRAALPWLVGLGASAALSIALADDVAPISTWLRALVPPLNAFRAPARSFMSAGLLLPILAFASLLCASRREDARTGRPVVVAAAGVALLAACAFLPVPVREAVAWAVAIAVVVAGRARRAQPAVVALALCALAGASASAFRERLTLPLRDLPAMLADLADLRARVVAAEPRLASPLVRVSLAFAVPDFSSNAGAAAGLSTLDGYWYPSRRFGRLFAVLSGTRYDPLAVYYAIDARAPSYAPLAVLYDACCLVRLVDGVPVVDRHDLGIGPAWFSGGVTRVPTWDALARAIDDVGAELPRRLRASTWIVDEDVGTSGPPAASVPSCADGVVHDARVGADRATIDLDVTTTGACPLVVATNYFDFLRATSVDAAGRATELDTFPANGALLGVVVPAGTTRLRVTPAVDAPLWSRAAQVAGGAMLLGAFAFVVVRRRRADATG